MINDTGSDNNTVDELIDNIYEEVAQLVDRYRERVRGSHDTTTDSEDLSATRVCYTDECGEPCRSYVESLRAERDAARKAAGVAGERLGMKRAEVHRWRAAWDMALPLLIERDELAAKVARVEALADEWDRENLRRPASDGPVTAYLHECAIELRAVLSEGGAKSAHINDTSAGRCTAALTIKGETFRCDLAAEHSGWVHSNRPAEAVWNGGEPR